MLHAWLMDLVRMEAVNDRAMAQMGDPFLQEEQATIATSLERCRTFAGAERHPFGEVEPMDSQTLAGRKRQSLALLDGLAEATLPMGSPLHTDLQRIRRALERQVGHLEGRPLPRREGDFSLAEGYRLEMVAGGLVFPTSIEFDDEGRIYVLEGGFSYPTTEAVARVLRLDPGGPVEVARGFRGPATALTFHDGAFFIAEGGNPARITRLSRDGSERATLYDDLHTGGDHFTTDLAIGRDGAFYFGVGTATNSGVVGLDNLMSWGTIRPSFHDVPARDLKLRGINFDVMLPNKRKQVTGAFKPLGEPSKPGEVIPGRLKANAAVYRATPDGSRLQVYADGLRNPFGLGFDPRGRLLAVDQGMDARGARPVANDWEPVWEVKEGGWYGWPDFASGLPVTNPRFKPADGPQPQFLLAEHPPLAGQPLARLVPHSGSVKFAFAPQGGFGYPGQMFIAQVGDFSPMTQKLQEPRGFRVVRLNLETGQAADFYVNQRPNAGGSGLERPVAVKFAPDGSALYVLDFGLLQTYPMTMVPKAGSGGLWRVVPTR